nr:MAG TPA: hypothetical protein [Crassvirales sp.]DAG99248.1 MAG TPA: hypothetical protein [Crassvirales sp.]
MGSNPGDIKLTDRWPAGKVIRRLGLARPKES